MNKPKYFATGIRLGLVEPIEIQAWVDAEIMESVEPSDELLALAYTKENSLHEIYSLLSVLADDSDEYEVVRILLSEIEQNKLESIEFCWRLTKCLYAIWVEQEYSAPEDLRAIGFLEDEYRMACNGTLGTIEEWHEKFKGFVSSLATAS